MQQQGGTEHRAEQLKPVTAREFYGQWGRLPVPHFVQLLELLTTNQTMLDPGVAQVWANMPPDEQRTFFEYAKGALTQVAQGAGSFGPETEAIAERGLRLLIPIAGEPDRPQPEASAETESPQQTERRPEHNLEQEFQDIARRWVQDFQTNRKKSVELIVAMGAAMRGERVADYGGLQRDWRALSPEMRARFVPFARAAFLQAYPTPEEQNDPQMQRFLNEFIPAVAAEIQPWGGVRAVHKRPEELTPQERKERYKQRIQEIEQDKGTFEALTTDWLWRDSARSPEVRNINTIKKYNFMLFLARELRPELRDPVHFVWRERWHKLSPQEKGEFIREQYPKLSDALPNLPRYREQPQEVEHARGDLFHAVQVLMGKISRQVTQQQARQNQTSQAQQSIQEPEFIAPEEDETTAMGVRGLDIEASDTEAVETQLSAEASNEARGVAMAEQIWQLPQDGRDLLIGDLALGIDERDERLREIVERLGETAVYPDEYMKQLHQLTSEEYLAMVNALLPHLNRGNKIHRAAIDIFNRWKRGG